MDYLTKVELLAVLQVARKARERDWLMYVVAYWHGLRASEVVGMTPLAVANGYLTIRRLKGSDTTTQELIEDEEPLLNERAALESLAQNTPSVSRLFPFSRIHYFRLFRKYARQAGVPDHKQHPHCLKHSVARHHIKDMGIENVRKHLGHKSMQSTGEYLKVTSEESDAALKRARGKNNDAA